MTLQAKTRPEAVDAGPVEGIPLGEGRVVLAGGVRVALFRTRAGEVFATQAECPHRGGPLADGILGGHTVVCPLHEYRFDLKDGAPAGNGCAALKTYRAVVDDRGHFRIDVEADK
jgi:nitrite reductase (NADH) small subunit